MYPEAPGMEVPQPFWPALPLCLRTLFMKIFLLKPNKKMQFLCIASCAYHCAPPSV